MKQFNVETPTLMLVQTTPFFGEQAGIQGFGSDPSVTYLTFPNRDRAEDARKQIDAAKVNGLTVIPLYGDITNVVPQGI